MKMNFFSSEVKMNFVKDNKQCQCVYCSEWWGIDGCQTLEAELEAGSCLGEIYKDSQLCFCYYKDKEPLVNPPLFPDVKGTIIDELVIKKIAEWEEQCRSLGDMTIIDPVVYLIISVIKIHIGHRLDLVTTEDL